nr:MAG TPA: hypothetical protein [Caudoviricetes sp.]
MLRSNDEARINQKRSCFPNDKKGVNYDESQALTSWN